MSCKNLVLDAGPLLSLSPLRGLAQTYYTVPQVLSELKDKRARDHFDQLGLTAGVNVEIASPDPASLAAVIRTAKKTGDYSVLSHPDLCVLALTYSLHEREKNLKKGQDSVAPSETPAQSEIKPEESPSETTVDEPEIESDLEEETRGEDLEPLNVELEPIDTDEHRKPPEDLEPASSPPSSPEPIFDDPSDEDDGEGEWITPSNVGLHKSRALDLLPQSGTKARGKQKEDPFDVGCMTADFAMQNVLLQMGLNLVGVEGQRIQKLKSWVLRCHACFKICKDNSKKFCPSCGNPTLLRASVTISSPDAPGDAPVMEVHLKRNFQYKLRGTKYSIPAPKPGSAKTGTGEGLILREDQSEYVRAKKMADGRKQREEAKMNKGLLGQNGGIGSWLDPDWVPEMLTVGAGGKGRTVRPSGRDGDMPVIGHGRKNPNERKRRR
ncbi:20S-pre-rRNA D-site endonuclease NOB1 [Mycena indigotica]|uniref:20S-pre-rRNA D-site endonuclease NOB1 n=1 Tax=Mycena indigotica TaxID=2126181 RepID=A0A8H6SMU2_9AGAR|nr:20S-pre-rRNA D-site endonuclease NOB1 [Mycena indigotica]KAF7301928.1 20S-pre-rRNA D-site endonuclease NOB1 [Mycena indigotica]